MVGPFSQPGARYAGITTDATGNAIRRGVSAHAQELLRARQRKLFRLYRQRGGNVEIEELPKQDEEEKPE